MRKHLISEDKNHQQPKAFENPLEEILREGARRLLQEAIENEVEEHLQMFLSEREENGKRAIVRNGYLPERSVQTGIGPIRIKQPRVRDKRKESNFTSAIFPPYMRRTPSVEAVIPALYLKGLSTGDFSEALESILGENVKGLSATNIVRLKSSWEEEYKEWSRRDLSGRRYVYFWVDGIYFNVRLEDDRPCLLVIIGALEDGSKEVVGIYDGHRESKESWKEALYDLRRRGLALAPHLAIGDGALGFWPALEEVFPSTRHQRCWVHKTANILDKMSKSVHGHAKTLLHEMYMAPTKDLGIKAFDTFLRLYEAKYPNPTSVISLGELANS